LIFNHVDTMFLDAWIGSVINEVFLLSSQSSSLIEVLVSLHRGWYMMVSSNVSDLSASVAIR
jgi:hypothetical protein